MLDTSIKISSPVFVTGANGFIGQALCTNLKQRGLTVRALLRNNSSGPWHETLIGDLASKSIPYDCMSGVNTLFHLAGKVHALTETVEDVSGYQSINVEGTKLLLEAAERAKVQRFVYFSSVKAIGEGGTIILDENSRLPPETPYGRSKLEAENLVLNSSIPHVTLLRPAMVYGPGNPGNLGRMISAIHKGFFPPFPKIDNHRSMVHVQDVVQAALLAAENAQAHRQVYILTDGQTYSTRQIYQWICQALDKPIPAWSVPLPVLQGLARIGDAIGAVRGKRFLFDSDALAKLTGSAAYSSAKIQTELGFAPQWTLEHALPIIVQSYIKQDLVS
ncbi:MAG: NAD-dependent epimerase/dehydratase family protein [Magnetococcus sp. YQC-5]